MEQSTEIFVGIDVSQARNAIAVATEGRNGEVRYVGEVDSSVDSMRRLIKRITAKHAQKSCRCCEKIVQAPAPTRPIYRGMFGPSLIAHILVSKFDDHLPLYRQGEIFARLGADIPRSTLIDGSAPGSQRCGR